jgi:His/Glu/Gln/Arg/opine family amino acid ABC transporter permease subunit
MDDVGTLLTTWAHYWTNYLAQGLATTIATMLIATAITAVWALFIVLLRLSGIGVLSTLAKSYIEFFRGTPVLVQLFLFFFVPSAFGILVAPWPTAIFVLTMHLGTFLAESYRSGYNAVPRGQREAAAALGMGRTLVLRRVIGPQAIRAIVPAIGNVLVWMLLSTPLTATIGIPEMMYQAMLVQGRFHDFSVFGLLTILYAGLAVLLGAGNAALERTLRLP